MGGIHPLKEEDRIQKEGREKENTSKKTYLSEKLPETVNSLSRGNACVWHPLIACMNPTLGSSLLFSQSTGPLEVEPDGIAYAVVVDMATRIVL